MNDVVFGKAPPGAPPNAPPGSPPGKPPRSKFLGLVSVPIPVPRRRQQQLTTTIPPLQSSPPLPPSSPVPIGSESVGDESTLSELALPELERVDESKPRIEITDSSEEPTHVDLGVKPPAESEDTEKKGDHPELKYKPPEEIAASDLKLRLPPLPRAKLDGYGMFAAVAALLALFTSPVFLDLLAESPLSRFSDPGVELHVQVFPTSSRATGVWISGFRVPYGGEASVHVPYGGPYKLQIKRDGFQDYTTELSFHPSKDKKDPDERPLAVTLVADPYGVLNVGSSNPCAVEIGDGMTQWNLKTPVRELKVPPSDYVVKFIDPKCEEKQFYLPVRAGGRSYVVYEFPTNSKESGYQPPNSIQNSAAGREPAGNPDPRVGPKQ